MKALDTDQTARALTEKLQQHLPALMAKRNVPGLSLAVIRQAKPYWSDTFGVTNRATQATVTQDTLFEGASLSKPVFAYACLKLCEDKLLSLDTPLSNYLPEPYLPDEPLLQQMTMRHILSHTSGFPNWRPDGKPLKIHFTPGERHSYSGEGYMYLQAVLAHLTGQEPAEYMRDQTLQPLGMADSYYSIAGLVEKPIAVGHDKKGKPVEKKIWPQMYAAASLHSTANDFAQFMCALMQPDEQNPHHLKPETIDEMLTPQAAVNDNPPWAFGWPKRKFRTSEKLSWGLGWGLAHTTAGDSIWHWGDNGTFRAYAVGYPQQGTGIVMMTNGQNGHKVISEVLRSIVGGEYPGLMWLKNPKSI